MLNEAYCMSLAAAFGLAVANCRVVLHGLVTVLSVQRFDRLQAGECVTRIHMEDFCQLNGLPPARKYEREGGARLSDIGALLRRFSARPALDLQALIRWTIFNFLIGFGGGHTKQIAMLYGADGLRLSPFFGIWSTHVYAELSSRLALTVGREDRPDWLLAARWQELAENLGVGPRYVLLEVRDSAASLPRLAAEVPDQFRRRNGFAAIVRRIRRLIEQRSRQALVSLEAEGVSL